MRLEKEMWPMPNISSQLHLSTVSRALAWVHILDINVNRTILPTDILIRASKRPLCSFCQLTECIRKMTGRKKRSHYESHSDDFAYGRKAIRNTVKNVVV